MKIYCNVCDKYKEYFETLNFFKITLAVSIVYSKCGHKKYLKKRIDWNIETSSFDC